MVQLSHMVLDGWLTHASGYRTLSICAPRMLLTASHRGALITPLPCVVQMLPKAEYLYEGSGCEAAGGQLDGFRSVLGRVAGWE